MAGGRLKEIAIMAEIELVSDEDGRLVGSESLEKRACCI
jgi:hypothetical protein